MPNKTIYVSDDDLPLYQRAQELTGGSLSAAISAALRRYLEIEEGRQSGFEEITVRVGPGKGRKQRFAGVLIAELGHQVKGRVEEFKVYRTRKGRYAVHIERSEDWSWKTAEGKDISWTDWRAVLGMTQQSWGSTAGEAVLEVVDTLDELRDLVPDQLYDMVAKAAEYPAVEDLDI
ncbi:EXLDI protein [Herbihabitans rhizosphaerae]|uniref:EXLDI protein n=1 Tax=Herbihabitans rhizosphaerae TaxID=1872711 RepID=UPI00102B1A5B|nr:EXLDI protein [Herbihabitans rhizosphaerae]